MVLVGAKHYSLLHGSSMEEMEISLLSFLYKNGNVRFHNINSHPITVKDNYFKLIKIPVKYSSIIWNIVAEMA